MILNFSILNIFAYNYLYILLYNVLNSNLTTDLRMLWSIIMSHSTYNFDTRFLQRSHRISLTIKPLRITQFDQAMIISSKCILPFYAYWQYISCVHITSCTFSVFKHAACLWWRSIPNKIYAHALCFICMVCVAPMAINQTWRIWKIGRLRNHKKHQSLLSVHDSWALLHDTWFQPRPIGINHFNIYISIHNSDFRKTQRCDTTLPVYHQIALCHYSCQIHGYTDFRKPIASRFISVRT